MTSASCHYVLTVDKSCVPPVQSSSKKKKEKKIACVQSPQLCVCVRDREESLLLSAAARPEKPFYGSARSKGV